MSPDTVVRWHRQGFRLYWRRKSRKRGPGRPPTKAEIRDLVKQMASDNPTWGAPRIRSELRILGYRVAESTVARYMDRKRKTPPQNWLTFLRNHMEEMASIDFFTAPTATFRILFAFIVIEHSRRKIVHFNVTSHPTAEWTAQQIAEAFPYETAPRFMIRDRDSVYGEAFRRRAKNMGAVGSTTLSARPGIDEAVTFYRCPPRSARPFGWQNPFAERVIGSIRGECLDHMIVFSEDHLYRILRQYFRYYHESRCHMSLDGNSPEPRDVEGPEKGKVVAIPYLGGLHHRYARAA